MNLLLGKVDEINFDELFEITNKNLGTYFRLYSQVSFALALRQFRNGSFLKLCECFVVGSGCLKMTKLHYQLPELLGIA